MALLWTMVDYRFVLLVVLVRAVTISSFKYINEPCSLFAKISTDLETKEGDTVEMRMVYCTLSHLENESLKFNFDISWAFNATTDINHYNLVYVSVVLWCISPFELDFINPHNMEKKNIVLALSLRGVCKASVQNLAVFAKATDLRLLGLKGTKATWLAAPGFRNVTHGNDSLTNDTKKLSYLVLQDSFPADIRATFSDLNNVWREMAEVNFERVPVKGIPEQWKTTMPLLQRLLMVECNLTKPPEFPWSDSTLEYQRGLRRTADSFHTVTSIHVQGNLYVRVLRLDYNNIVDLTSHEFSGLLHVLSLRGNGLRTIGPLCFRKLRGIQRIDLSRNNLVSLPQDLFQGLTSLRQVYLRSNKLKIIEQKLFKDLKNVTIVHLRQNNLDYIPKGLFNSLDSLKILDMGTNNITQIEENPFSKNASLQVLYLDNNRLSSIPSWIFLLPDIRIINLSSNGLKFQDLDKALDSLIVPFEGETKQLRDLDLSGNNITTLIDSDGLKMIKRDERINPVYQAKYLYLWKSYSIKLNGNPLACDCIMSTVAQEVKKLVQSRPYIRSRFSTWKCHWPQRLKNRMILEIEEDQWIVREEKGNTKCPVQCICLERCSDRRMIVDCERRNLTEVPSVVPQGLVELNLEANAIQSVPAYPYMVNVTILRLTNNQIKSLTASTVERLENIEILLIDANQLTTLPREIKTLNFTTLALDGNFFKCDCTTKWMKDWLVKERNRIKNIERVLCNSEHVHGQPMYSLPDDQFICLPQLKEKNAGIIAACILGALLALVMIVAVLIYKYNGEVKVFMFTHFNWHPFDRIDDSDPNKIYDAFVSFSGNDVGWVVNTLQRRLETHDPPYKLCIHHRDFEPGVPIVENIWKSLDQSKRMLVVLSSSYATSDWCLMEFRAAHRKVIEDRMKYLILILLEDVDTNQLDKEIQNYLRSNTYLTVKSKWFWQNLFYAMPFPTREITSERNQEHFAAIEEEREMACNTGDTVELV